MEKGVKIFLILMIVSTTLWAQSSFQDQVNVVMFSGYHLRQENINNNGYWLGTYIDYSPYKTRNWNIGVYVLYSKSKFQDNILQYNGRIEEYTLGLISGYYSHFSIKNQIFIGFSLGYNHVIDHGNSHNLFGNVYEGEQKDQLISTNINLNFLHNSTTFSRTQLLLFWKKPIKSTKKATWNQAPIEGSVWDKTYIEILGKETFLDFDIGRNIFSAAKVITIYSYSKGNKENNYGGGMEISLHHKYQDDFISLYGLYKLSNISKRQEFVYGINCNLINIFFNK